MALIVEDGTGLANAESYISTAELQQYLTNYGLTGPTDEASSEIYLRRATRAINTLFRFTGEKYDEDQALHFPTGDDEPDVIPQAVKDATAEMVVIMFSGVDPMGSLDEQVAGLTEISKKVGELSVTKKWEAGTFTAPQISRLRTLKLLLGDWLINEDAAPSTWYTMELYRG